MPGVRRRPGAAGRGQLWEVATAAAADRVRRGHADRAVGGHVRGGRVRAVAGDGAHDRGRRRRPAGQGADDDAGAAGQSQNDNRFAVGLAGAGAADEGGQPSTGGRGRGDRRVDRGPQRQAHRRQAAAADALGRPLHHRRDRRRKCESAADARAGAGVLRRRSEVHDAQPRTAGRADRGHAERVRAVAVAGHAPGLGVDGRDSERHDQADTATPLPAQRTPTEPAGGGCEGGRVVRQRARRAG